MVLYNEDTLRQLCPAAFSENPSADVSDKYSFLPTTDILSLLEEEDWVWHKAEQVNPTIKSREHSKHLIRLRKRNDVGSRLDVGGSFPELLVTNSHNGTGSYTLRAGIFRLVCSNGMVVAENDFGKIRIRHRGFDPEEVRIASHKIAQQGNRTIEVMNRWRDLSINRDEQFEFARRVAPLRFKEFDDELVHNLLSVRRTEDQDNSFWTTFNRVQENLMRGGFRNGASGRIVKSINGINKDIEINSKLWDKGTTYFSEVSVN